MTSPARISARCNDSSNRAAKDSDIDCFVRIAPRVELSIPGTSALAAREECRGPSYGRGVVSLPPPEGPGQRPVEPSGGGNPAGGIFGRLQGSDGAGGIPQVARLEVGPKSGECS